MCTYCCPEKLLACQTIPVTHFLSQRWLVYSKVEWQSAQPVPRFGRRQATAHHTAHHFGLPPPQQKQPSGNVYALRRWIKNDISHTNEQIQTAHCLYTYQRNWRRREASSFYLNRASLQGYVFALPGLY